MSNNHTLRARLTDLILEIKLWLLGWSITSTTLVTSAFYFLKPADGAGFWQQYLIAKPLNWIGAGMLPILPTTGWRPAIFLEYVYEKLPAAVLTDWDRHLSILLQLPLAAAALTATVYMVWEALFKKEK